MRDNKISIEGKTRLDILTAALSAGKNGSAHRTISFRCRNMFGYP